MIRKIILESSIDFPGKFGPVIFVSGCTFRCGFCHNAGLMSEEKDIDENDIIEKIKTKTKAGWYTGVCITGGEPTIHPELLDFIKKLKSLGLAVKLDTNGSNPELLKKILNSKLVDYVAMDIKGQKEDYEKIVRVKVDLEKIEESMKLVVQFPKYEFRTTILKKFHSSENILKMVKWISQVIEKKPILFLQGFSSRGDLLDPSFYQEPEVKEDYLLELKKIIDTECEIAKIR